MHLRLMRAFIQKGVSQARLGRLESIKFPCGRFNSGILWLIPDNSPEKSVSTDSNDVTISE